MPAPRQKENLQNTFLHANTMQHLNDYLSTQQLLHIYEMVRGKRLLSWTK
jgi:hypothetical protein